MEKKVPLAYQISPFAWMLLSSVILTTLLWLPFGFHLGGVIEEWGFQASFDRYGPTFVCDAKSPFPTIEMRPLLLFPYALAYSCDPNSFIYYHLILMADIGLKCFAFSVIVWILTKSRRLALLGGVLLVLYPADTMQLCFRTLSINFSLSMILSAVACVLCAYEASGNLAKVLFSVSAALLVVFAVLMYEAAIVLLPLPFIILWIRSGFGRALRLLWEQKAIGLSWGLSFGVCALYEINVAAHHLTYEGNISDSPQSILAHLPLIFSIGFVRSLAGGWYDAFGMLLTEFHNYSYLVIMVVIILGLLYLVDPRRYQAEPEVEPWSGKFISRLIGGGLLLIFFGYLPTLPSYAHILITQRTYLFSSPGACLVWLGLLLFLLKKWRHFAVVLAAVMILAGSAAQLFQFHHYIALWDIQRNIIKTIVTSVPSLPEGKTLLVIDASGRLNDDWMLEEDLGCALSYFHHRTIPTEICLQPGNDWELLDSAARPGQCVETASTWQFFHLPPLEKSAGPPKPNQLIREIPKSKIQVVKIEADGSSATALPEDQVLAAMDGDRVRLSRYHNLLESPSWKDSFGLFPSTDQPTQFRWDFGRWWNLDLPNQGTGWRANEWAVNYFLHDSFSWKIEPEATLLFKLYPEKKPYMVEGSFLYLSPNTRKQNVKLQLNGHEIPLAWTGEKTFRGELDNAQIQTGMNELKFIAPEDSELFNLSIALDWVSLHSK